MRVCTRLVAVWLLFSVALVTGQAPALAPPERIADGVALYRLNDSGLLSPPGPVAVQALRLDPRKVTLEIRRGGAAEPARETVEAIAARRPGAIAVVNGGFFSLETGNPTAFLKIGGEVVKGTSRARGAVGIIDERGVTKLLFDRVTVATRSGRPEYTPRLGSSPKEWARAPHAVGGAGLLILNGRELTEWREERISEGFDTTRHPRTLIGVDAQDAIWLVTVDGRNPSLSLGMSFTELKRLSRRLGLRTALNLDGGGSTTMAVTGKIVNHPSDPGGPRKVSDGILVVPRTR